MAGQRQHRQVTAEGRLCGESHGRCKIPDATVKLIRDLYELQCLTARDIAERLRLNYNTVRKICCYQRRVAIARWE